MQTLQLKDVIDKLKNNELQYNQFYNANIEASHYFAIQHFAENKHDTIDMNQKLKILFFDIECYFNNQTEVVDFKKAEGVINAITIYDNKTKIYHAFLLLMSDKNQNLVDFDNKEEYIKTYKKELIENNYITEDEDIQLYFYVDDELTFIEECWQLIHQVDSVLLSGFNADGFDLPYFYNRLTKLYNGDEKKTANTLSKFGVVKTRKYSSGTILYQIPEYPIADIRRLYVPRDEGGYLIRPR